MTSNVLRAATPRLPEPLATLLLGYDHTHLAFQGALHVMRLVTAGSQPACNRLGVAIAHLESAIAHINNDAQSRMPAAPNAISVDIDELRLIVCALADIIGSLHSKAAATSRVA